MQIISLNFVYFSSIPFVHPSYIVHRPFVHRSSYLLLFRRLQSRQSIWQLEAIVRPPSTHGVI